MNETFIWTPEYSVQNALIDGQHQTFFLIANELEDLASKEEVDRDMLLVQATKLGDYAFFHLSTEEDMFNKYGYNGSEHVAVHNMFREKVGEMMDAIRSEASDTKEEAKKMADFAGTWLKDHIMVMDKQYAPFFTEKGLK